MFTRLTNFVFGETGESSHSVEHQLHSDGESVVQEEWVLVKPNEQVRIALPNEQMSFPPTPISSQTTTPEISQPATPMSCSWLVSPPTNITASNNLNENPMENMLIEHPSMSVYQNLQISPPWIGQRRQRSVEIGGIPASNGTVSLIDTTPAIQLRRQLTSQQTLTANLFGWNRYEQKRKKMITSRKALKLKNRMFKPRNQKTSAYSCNARLR